MQEQLNHRVAPVAPKQFVEDKDPVALEAAVIATLLQSASLQDGDRAANLMRQWRLVPEDFENGFARQLYSGMVQLHAEGQAPAFMALKQRLSLPHEAWCQALSLLKSQPLYYPAMGKDLRSKSAHRRLTAAIQELAGQSVDAILQTLRQEMDDIQNRETPIGSDLSLAEDTKRIVEDIQNGAVPEWIYTGSTDLTRTLSGYRRGQLIIMAGRPSMGKSMVAQSLGLQIAKRNHGVLMFALEMSRDEHIYRALSDLSYTSSHRLEYRDIQGGNVAGNSLAMIARAANDLNNLPFTICDKPGLTLDDIQARIRAYKKELAAAGKSLDVVIVDHIGHVRDTGQYRGNRNNQIGEITAGLLRIAKEMQVVIIGVCQLNRQTENRENKRPQLSDLRDSGNIEQDANSVVFVYREAYYIERMPAATPAERADRDGLLATAKHRIELLVAKNRQGPTATLELYCDAGCNVVRDMGR